MIWGKLSPAGKRFSIAGLENSLMSEKIKTGLVALVPDWWDGPTQTRHQVMERLSKDFKICWVNPPVEWRKQWLSGETSPKPEFEQINDNLTVYTPSKFLPLLFRPQILADWTEKQRYLKAIKYLKKSGCKKIGLYLWRPKFINAAFWCDFDFKLYHIDDEYSFSTTEKPLDPTEVKLIKKVDQVIIHSRTLMEKKGQLNPQTAQIPNGVNFALYSKKYPEPDDLKNIPRPIVGYTGRIKSQLNFGLLLEIARDNPEISFVFVGPVSQLGDEKQNYDELLTLPNVYFLGSKNAADLPAYVNNFDVCMMCYNLNDYTKYIYPLKLHEYLASGKPVVGTPIEALLEFDSIIRLAKDKAGWGEAIKYSLTGEAQKEEKIKERQKTAAGHDWDSLVGRISAIIMDKMNL